MPIAFLFRRLLLAVPTLLGVAAVVFVLLRVVPGDPIAMLTGPGATADDIRNLRALYGLDRGLGEQFLIYLSDLARIDLGTSISLRQDVLGLILERLPVTLELCLIAMLFAVGLGLAFGTAAAYWRGRLPELGIDLGSGLLLAVPDFLWALLFILFLGVLVPVMPVSGRIDLDLNFQGVTQFYLFESLLRGQWAAFVSVLQHALLPALSLALPLVAIIARVLKTSLNEAMAQDYAVMASVRGYSRARIVWREALRNALLPTVTLTGVQFTFLIGGTVLIEKIFGYPGIGNMAIDAVINRDLPLIQGIVLTFAVLFILVNLAIDMLYALLNPRLRHG